MQRKFLKNIDYENSYFFENYSDNKKPKNLLDAIKSEMLFQKEQKNTLLSLENESSFEIHSAPSKLREVQILYNNILKLLNDDPELSLDDITVFAPNINEYAPFINFVFVFTNL